MMLRRHGRGARTAVRLMRIRATARVLFVALLWTGGRAAAQTTDSVEYDIVIRNGRVLDGAGNPWIVADVAIRDGRFAALGVVRGRGAREIDARGRYVSPGWIDMMDQS